MKELKGYKRVTLKKGEATRIDFTLRKCDMGFYDNQGKYTLEEGLFRIYVGGTSKAVLDTEISVSFGKGEVK